MSPCNYLNNQYGDTWNHRSDDQDRTKLSRGDVEIRLDSGNVPTPLCYCWDDPGTGTLWTGCLRLSGKSPRFTTHRRLFVSDRDGIPLWRIRVERRTLGCRRRWRTKEVEGKSESSKRSELERLCSESPDLRRQK